MYSAKVADFYVPYIRPQENGYRTDVRSLSFTNQNGKVIKILANNVFSFSVACFDFYQPDANQIQFMLEGFDRGWREDIHEGGIFDGRPFGGTGLTGRRSFG